MTIPDYQTLMLPILKRTTDQQEHRLPEFEEVLAQEFALTPEEQMEMLPSGNQKVFKNRITWAITYLRKAGLIENRGCGIYAITKTGIELLATNPVRITSSMLRQYQGFDTSSETQENLLAVELDELLDPLESLDKSYRTYRQILSEQLLETVKKSTPAFFERLVIDVLLAMGYGGSHQDILEALRGKTGDEGIDGVIKEDPLGLEEIYVQAKRYQDSVIGRPLVQAFAGSLAGFHARKGVFITSSSFSREVYGYIQKVDKKIALIDGQQLVQLMIDHNVGVTNKQSYTLKQIDSDYFEMN